jgi:two-component system, OmpR family, sensor kinase
MMQRVRQARHLLAAPRPPRSLRLSLALWYGGLLAVALGTFVILVLGLATRSVEGSVESAIGAEARVATLDIRSELSPDPPYWPDELHLNVVDTYRDPGITIEVVSTGGQVRFHSGGASAAQLPETAEAVERTLHGEVVWTTIRIDDEDVRLEVLPVRLPAASGSAGSIEASGAPAGQESIIGALLVAKSLGDVNATLVLLRTLLLGAGLLTLAGALVGGWAIAGRALQPLAELGATASSIAQETARGTRLGGLSRRVPRPRGNDELAHTVDTVNEMLASLESATHAQRRFVADASHELRAPLTTIQGNLAFLQQHLDELPQEERREMLSDAFAETLQLGRLVDDLLVLARGDAGVDQDRDVTLREARNGGGPQTPSPSWEVLPVVEVDHELLQLVRGLRGRLRAEGVPLDLEIGRIEPARVRAEEETLRRIALILLDNAIKYTKAPRREDEDPGHAARVSVSVYREADQAVLQVQDNGVGISAEDLPHIFERFYRADRSRDRSGTGLGLAIASGLVEQLGGRIAATSSLGVGSTFSIWLPLADAALPAC